MAQLKDFLSSVFWTLQLAIVFMSLETAPQGLPVEHDKIPVYPDLGSVCHSKTSREHLVGEGGSLMMMKKTKKEKERARVREEKVKERVL